MADVPLLSGIGGIFAASKAGDMCLGKPPEIKAFFAVDQCRVGGLAYSRRIYNRLGEFP